MQALRRKWAEIQQSHPQHKTVLKGDLCLVIIKLKIICSWPLLREKLAIAILLLNACSIVQLT